MILHTAIQILDVADVVEARRAALRLATDRCVDEQMQARIESVVAELGNNLLRHASNGRLIFSYRVERQEMEILSIDSGPGISERLRPQDGLSANGLAGGLRTVRQASSEFSMFSALRRGTVVPSRLRGTPESDSGAEWIKHSAVCLAAPRETTSGDAWCVRVEGNKASVIVADGLGHGLQAARASDDAIEAFAHARGEPNAVLEKLHGLLRSTVGAAVSIVNLEEASETITFSGAGNVIGRVISGVTDSTLMPQSGTIGVRTRHLKNELHSWLPHAIIVLHSDGLMSRWKLQEVPGLLQCDTAVIAGWLLRDYSRGNDDVTVVVLRRQLLNRILFQ